MMKKLYALSLVILFAILFFTRRTEPIVALGNHPKSASNASTIEKESRSDRKVSAATPDRAENLISKRRLVALIQADQYCGVEIQRLETSDQLRDHPARIGRLYRALLEAADQGEPDPCALALLSRTNAAAIANARRGSGVACRFILGTSLTGQWMAGLQDGKVTLVQEAEGNAILKQLAYENPDNGYFAFYALNALKKEDRAGQEEFYVRMLRAEKYEEPFLPILEQLKRAGHLNPTAFMLVSYLVSIRGMPDQGRGSQYARALAAEGLYAEDFVAWAARSAEAGRKIDEAQLTEPWVNLLEQSVIRRIALAGSEKLGLNIPFFQLENWRGFFQRRVFPTDYTGLVSGEATCSELTEAVRQLQAKFFSNEDRQMALRL